MTLLDSVRYAHILGGTIALATFWTAATLRKGSSAHIGVGRSYLIAMCAVMVSAIPLSIAAFRAGTPVLGTFLLYLVVIIGGGVATHIAFLSLGLARFVPASHAQTIQYIAWFGPLTAAVAARMWLKRKYQTGEAMNTAPAVGRLAA